MHYPCLKAINRILLTWLKLWDKAVFGKGLDKKKKPKPEQNKKSNLTKKFKKHWKGTQEEADWNVSPFFPLHLLHLKGFSP